METPQEDTNPESKILYTMNIDSQEVNIVVDKETTEDKKKDMATKSPTVDVEIGVSDTVNISIEKPTQIEKSVEDTTGKPSEALVDKIEKKSKKPAVDSVEVNTEKPAVHTETSSKKLAVESTEKPSEA